MNKNEDLNMDQAQKKSRTKVLMAIILIGACILYARTRTVTPGTSDVTQTPSAAQAIAEVPAAVEEVLTEPRALHMNALTSDAISIESVELDDEGNMQTPKNAMNAAWLNIGVSPGQKGTAILAGHYDQKDLSPAIFFKLNEVKVGDTFDIEYQDGSRRTFEVYKTDNAPVSPELAASVFEAQTDEARVNLITCSGIWDKNTEMYTQRFIVYAQRKIP